MSQTPLHPLDRATLLCQNSDGTVTGRTDPAYAHAVGPFGGITAATMLNAVLSHPARLGEPVALTVNYAGPIAEGEFRIAAVPVRTNRSTQHWSISVYQGDTLSTTATAVFAVRRDTWSSTEAAHPEVPPATALQRLPAANVSAWIQNYDLRYVQGGLPDVTQSTEKPDSLSIQWIRDDPPRPMDFISLASICDAFFPRTYLRRTQRVPTGTVSLTIYFHANTSMLAAQAQRPVLGVARASHFGFGYHDQSAEIWSDDGVMLATSHQLVYFKE
jgi:acyl-CoA thioesterase